MKRTRKLALLLGTAVLLAPVALSAASCRAGSVGLVDGRLQDCPSSPNCVSSEPTEREEARIAPLEFEGDPDAALSSLLAFLEGEPRVRIEETTGDYVHAVFISRIFRFRDDVEFRLDRDAGLLHVRSASRVGYSDLGANRNRIESLRERWNRPPE